MTTDKPKTPPPKAIPVRHAIDHTRTYSAALCGASGGNLTQRTGMFVTCKRCRARLGLGPL